MNTEELRVLQKTALYMVVFRFIRPSLFSGVLLFFVRHLYQGVLFTAQYARIWGFERQGEGFGPHLLRNPLLLFLFFCFPFSSFSSFSISFSFLVLEVPALRVLRILQELDLIRKVAKYLLGSGRADHLPGLS